jgi:hypothetical protein
MAALFGLTAIPVFSEGNVTIDLQKAYFFDTNTLVATGTITNNTDRTISRIVAPAVIIYLDGSLVATKAFDFAVDIAPNTTRDIGYDFNVAKRPFSNWNIPTYQFTVYYK